MAFDFPNFPVVGQQFTPVAGTIYTWNGTGWVLTGPTNSSMVLLSAQTVSGAASVDFTGMLTTQYDEYQVHFFGVYSGTDADTLSLRVGEGGTYQTASSYNYQLNNLGGGTSTVSGTTTGGGVALTYPSVVSNLNTRPVSGVVSVFSPSNSVAPKNISYQITLTNNGNNFNSVVGSGRWAGDNNAVDSLRFYMGSGGTLTGTFKLYGIAGSALGAIGTGLARLGGRLSYSSATALLFTPYNGNQIQINGSLFIIPNAGIAGLANTSVFVNGTGASNLAASTTYYVYAFINSGVVTADFRTDGNGHITDTTAGNEGTEVRCSAGTTPDPTRSLIGMIRTNASSQFLDDPSLGRLVRSWFNCQPTWLENVLTSNASAVSTAGVAAEVSASLRCPFLCWANEVVDASFAGGAFTSGTGWFFAVGLDGTTFYGSTSTINSSNTSGAFTGISKRGDYTEGYHYVTALAGGTAANCTIMGGAPGTQRSGMTVSLLGR
jgi:hypothetical protein